MDRKSILENIKRNRPEEVPLPQIPAFEGFPDPVAKFVEISSYSSKVLMIEDEQTIDRYIDHQYSNRDTVINLVAGDSWTEIDVDDIELLVISGTLAVAENGAIWVHERDMGRRLLPFVTQHLMIVIDKNRVVSNMHEAYQEIEVKSHFGVFIAGPSKTADIEQSLVTGAHGPRSLTIAIF